MENKMCPLFLASSEFSQAEYCYCRKHECAWWDEKKQECALLAIAKKMGVR